MGQSPSSHSPSEAAELRKRAPDACREAARAIFLSDILLVSVGDMLTSIGQDAFLNAPDIDTLHSDPEGMGAVLQKHDDPKAAALMVDSCGWVLG